MVFQCADVVIAGERICFARLRGNIANVYFYGAAGLYGSKQVMHKQVGKNACIQTAGTYHDHICI